MQVICAVALAAGLMTTGTAMAQAHAGTPPTAPVTNNQAGNQAASQAPVPTGPAAEVQRGYAGVKANILKAATEMPDDAYTYKPEPDIRTFARVVNHVSEVQLRICGSVNHKDPADLFKVPAETADKVAIVEALKASFTECDKAYATATDTNLTEMFTLGKATRSRIGALWGNVSHDNEQYATLALYMRLKGLVPPSSEK
ncbi:DinB family protein [Granulicella sp. S156]|uniref:DinB family protein n=1 Tax=Granulicella sp. S156 TaxID=1747224 RepID=UPI0020B168BC|nr:DinB family protein [Granulicella sp. S156]